MAGGINADNIQRYRAFHNHKSFKEREIHANSIDRAKVACNIKTIYADSPIRLYNRFLEWRPAEWSGLGAKLCSTPHLGGNGALFSGGIMYVDRGAVRTASKGAIL